MSIAILNSVNETLDDPACDLPSRARLVLMLLASHASRKDGTCVPRLRRIAQMAGASLASIKRDCDALEARKHIKREKRFNPATGARTSSLITFPLHTGTAHSCDTTSAHDTEITPSHSCETTSAHSCETTNNLSSEPNTEPTFQPAGTSDVHSESWQALKAAFNGSTEIMVADVQKFMGPTAQRENAIKWLHGTLSSTGRERTLGAWTILTAKIGKGDAIRQPLALWAKTAGGLPAPAPDRAKMTFQPSRYGAGKWVQREAVQ